MKMRFLSDKPIEDSLKDDLGLRDFVQLIQGSIYHTETPFVFGILGDWGVGKTSVLHLLKNQLDKDLENGEHMFVPIWFNAWQYENEANMVYPLLHTIKSEYEKRIGALEQAKGFGAKFSQVAMTSIFALTDLSLRAVTKKVIDDSMSLDDIAKWVQTVQEKSQFDKALGVWADKVTELRGAFGDLLDTFAGELAITHQKVEDKKAVRFVILIDDLDRCLPDTTIALLESIKNYLDAQNCIFVLGLNPRVVYQSIHAKYKGLAIDGKEYLEKILNYHFYVPEPTSKRISKFAVERLNELVKNDPNRQAYQTQFTQFGEVVAECTFSNPRKIKRILNHYLFFIADHEKQQDIKAYYMPKVCRLIILAEYYPVLFDLLCEQPDPVQVGHTLAKESKEKIQDQYGISIPAAYPPLFRLKNLFKLGDNKPQLEQEVEAVSRITRFV